MACRFSAATVPEGKQVFLNPAEGNIYDVIRACLAVPGCYPAPVPMNGREYVDGATVNPLPLQGIPNGNASDLRYEKVEALEDHIRRFLGKGD